MGCYEEKTLLLAVLIEQNHDGGGVQPKTVTKQFIFFHYKRKNLWMFSIKDLLCERSFYCEIGDSLRSY